MADIGAGYQVYINVVSADLPNGSSSSSAPTVYAKILVDSKSRDDLETKKIDSGFQPVFNQEFVLNAPKSNSIITVKIKSFQRLGRNKTLGTADFDLSDLEEGKAKQLEGDITGGGSVTVVLCRKKNASIGTQLSGHELHVRLPALRVVLERDVYYPGEVIRGVVRYFERHHTSISAVRLAFEGHSHVTWTESNGQSSYTYTSKVCLLQHTSVLYGSQDYKNVTQVGPNFLFERAFEFRLPTDLAPTYSGLPHLDATIAYQVIAFIDRQKVQDKKERVPFRILSPPRYARLETAKVILKKLVEDNDVEVSMSAQRTFWAGKPYQIKISLDNSNGTKSIDSMKVKLRCCVWYYTRDGGQRTRRNTIWKTQYDGKTSPSSSSSSEHQLLEDEHQLLPVHPGSSRESTVTFTVPSNVAPSLYSTLSPLIQTSYFIFIKLKAEGGTFKTHSAFLSLNVTGLVEHAFQDSPSQAQPNQLLMYTPETSMDYAQFLIPLASYDGKHLHQGMSQLHGRFGNFADLGDSIETEHYYTHDSKFHPSNNTLKAKYWAPGMSPQWVTTRRTGEGLAPANIPGGVAAPLQAAPAARPPPTEPRMDETQKLDETEYDSE